MRREWIAGLVLTLCCVCANADEALDGRWLITAMERDGKADETMKGATREHAGDKYTVTPKSGKAIGGTIKLDAAAKTKTMDMMPTEGRYKGMTLKCIYKIDGEELVICFSEPGKDRPVEFSSKDGAALVTHKKQK